MKYFVILIIFNLPKGLARITTPNKQNLVPKAKITSSNETGLAEEKMNVDPNSIYPAIVRNGIKVNGFAAETCESGSSVRIVQKAFITSYEAAFPKFCNNLLKQLLGEAEGDSLNTLVGIIKENEKAFIYKKFPLQMKVRLRNAKKQFEVVLLDEILDINKVYFSDDIFNLDIQFGDKFFWLFRDQWKFGLYFDFTNKLEPDILASELATCYKSLKYFEYYSFLAAHETFSELVKDGWFPFIQLLGSNFDRLIQHYRDGKKYQFQINSIVDEFKQERIDQFTRRWWTNPHFDDKRNIIAAGIKAYFQDSEAGNINAIKTLSCEIEGILRIAYFKETGRRATTKEIKEYVASCGKEAFSTDSLGFPKLFYEYLSRSVFDSFDLSSGHIPSSRHSYAHGVAKIDNYTKIRALQLILTLDQIYFFLNSR